MSIELTDHAEVDIDTATEGIAEDVGGQVALLFQHRLRETLLALEAFPESGSPVDPPFLRYPGLRVRPVRRFKARLVFYFPTATGIRVQRVLHAGQNMADHFN